MAKTFEALMKAEQERDKNRKLSSVIRPEPFFTSPRPTKLETSSQILTEFQRIRDNICLIDPERKIKCLMFSSPTQGEGNSTILINFAITLASGGERVLIVDSNLRNPSFHHIFNLERENGLTELILGEKTLPSVKKETRFSNLSVITSGKNHSNPSSLFEFKALDIHIGEMKRQVNWVIFDSPPINSFNDPITLASKVDGVILVVHAETTRTDVALKAKQRMQASNARILGAVLNQRKFYIPDWLYKTL